MTFRENSKQEVLLKQLVEAASAPFDQAVPIPAAAHHSSELLELERGKIFQNEWICVGREDEIADPGQFLTHEIANVSVLLVRQKDGSIESFANACAHRFACLVPDKNGQRKKIYLSLPRLDLWYRWNVAGCSLIWIASRTLMGVGIPFKNCPIPSGRGLFLYR